MVDWLDLPWATDGYAQANVRSSGWGRRVGLRRYGGAGTSGTWVLVLERTEPVLSIPGESQQFELTAVM